MAVISTRELKGGLDRVESSPIVSRKERRAKLKQEASEAKEAKPEITEMSGNVKITLETADTPEAVRLGLHQVADAASAVNVRKNLDFWISFVLIASPIVMGVICWLGGLPQVATCIAILLLCTIGNFMHTALVEAATFMSKKRVLIKIVMLTVLGFVMLFSEEPVRTVLIIATLLAVVASLWLRSSTIWTMKITKPNPND